jgi:hypothetical protein
LKDKTNPPHGSLCDERTLIAEPPLLNRRSEDPEAKIVAILKFQKRIPPVFLVDLKTADWAFPYDSKPSKKI